MAAKTWPFDTPANYIYDPEKIEVAGGLAKLKKEILIETYGHWHLNESSGAITADSSGNNRDGILINMENEDWQPGKLNNCLRFDGINEYVNLGDIAGFERTDPFSLECWFKSGVADGFFISKFYRLVYRGWSLYLANGKIYFMLANSQSNRAFCGTVNTFDDGQWHHLIATYNGSSDINNARIYVDGTSQSKTINENGVTSTIQNERNCYMGVRDVADYYFNGRIDEAVIYDKELSQAEVTLRWNSGNGIEEMLSDIYPTDKPTIRPASSWHTFGLLQLTAFTAALGPGNQGSIEYQLSEDDGAIWQYWNGEAWAAAGADDHNDTATILANLASFIINSDRVTFRAFLISDGTQKAELATMGMTAEKVVDWLRDIKTETDKLPAFKEIQDFLMNIEAGCWEIKKNQLIFYKYENDMEELMRFNLYNKVGKPTEKHVYKRCRQR